MKPHCEPLIPDTDASSLLFNRFIARNSASSMSAESVGPGGGMCGINDGQMVGQGGFEKDT